MQNFPVGHVHFMLFMSISFASGTQRKLVFQWNMGLKVCVISIDGNRISDFQHYRKQAYNSICDWIET